MYVDAESFWLDIPELCFGYDEDNQIVAKFKPNTVKYLGINLWSQATFFPWFAPSIYNKP